MAAQLLGVPYDAHSSFLRGPAGAPVAVRRVLASGVGNWTSESGAVLDPLDGGGWTDLGDLDLPEQAEPALSQIRAAAAEAIEDGSPLLSIGGDHIVSWPLVSAMSDRYDDLTVLHFDAHPDLYDHLDGDRFSHACPFARIMEENKVGRLVQLGIRTATAHQHEQAERFGVEMIEYPTWNGVVPDLSGPLYISIDIDALDPAFAPGMSHHEPGGMSVRELIGCLHRVAAMNLQVVGADIVEINPTRDLHDMTAAVGAKLVKELLAQMV